MSEDFYSQIAQPFTSLELLASQVVEGFLTGLNRSPFHGFSVEFAEHRQYNQGESVRHVDWKLYGRTDRLFVKKFQEETNLRCHILIDASSSMLFPVMSRIDMNHLNKLAFSVCASAALMNLLVRQRDAVGFHFFSSSENFQTEVRSSRSYLKYQLGELEKRFRTSIFNPQTGVGSDIVATLHQAAEQIHKRSLIILFSDMFDGQEDMNSMFDALQHLKYHQNEVLLFHVTRKSQEQDLAFAEKHCCFIDMETGKELRLNPSEVKDLYRERYGAYLDSLKMKCAQYGIDFIDADVDDGFVPVLQQYMLKRSRIFR